jgi:hypothetical protein
VGIRCADHATTQKLALTAPTSGGRSFGIVRLRTKATEFSLVLVMQVITHTLYKNFTEDVKATECITDSKTRHPEIKDFASESNLLWPPYTRHTRTRSHQATDCESIAYSGNSIPAPVETVCANRLKLNEKSLVHVSAP